MWKSTMCTEFMNNEETTQTWRFIRLTDMIFNCLNVKDTLSTMQRKEYTAPHRSPKGKCFIRSIFCKYLYIPIYIHFYYITCIFHTYMCTCIYIVASGCIPIAGIHWWMGAYKISQDWQLSFDQESSTMTERRLKVLLGKVLAMDWWCREVLLAWLKPVAWRVKDDTAWPQRAARVVEKLKCNECTRFADIIRGRRNFSKKQIIGADSVHTSNAHN